MAMASVLPSVAAFGGGGANPSCKPSSSLSFVALPLSSPASASPFPRPLLSFRVRAQPPPMSELDAAAFEADRLRLDAQARLDMMQVAAAVVEGATASSKEGSTSSAENGGTPAHPEGEEDVGAWKWRIRKRIWDLMERENIAAHPRPVHHRIPNFVGAATAAEKLASLPAFQAANCVKVNPDTPQKQVRYLTLEGNKKLLTPQPRLRTGFFSELEASSLPPGVMAEACTAVGVAKYGKPLGLDAKLKVDLIVIGSVAVDPKTGARLGKGEGFAELEYAMLRHMGAIDDSTLVVTSVHDKQLVDDIPTEKLKVHDVPVDIICTPTHIIHTKTTIPKPKGIYWELLSPEKLGQVLVLRQLKKQIEKETGQKLPSGPSEKLPPTAQRRPMKQQPVASEKASNDEPCVFVWNLDISTTWKELKEHVSKAGAEALKVNILRKGTSRPMARITLKEGTDIEGLVKALDGSQLGGSTLRAKINSVPEKDVVSAEPAGGSMVKVKANSALEKALANSSPEEALANSVPDKALVSSQPVASEKASNDEPCIFVWNLDISTTRKELKEHVSKAGAEVVRMNILRKGTARPMARIHFKEGTNIEDLVKALDSSQLGGSTMRAKINSVPEKAPVSSQPAGGLMVKA